MFDKQKVREAVVNIDGILGKAKFVEPVLNREEHAILAQNLALLQSVCAEYFTNKEESKDGGTDEQPEHPTIGDQDS